MRSVLVALAVALTLVVHPTDAPVSFAQPCRIDCPGSTADFQPLRGHISDPGLVPAQFQSSLLQQATLAEQAHPTDPCRSIRHLRALSGEVNGLLQGARINATAANTLQGDVNVLVGVIAPTDPC
jgi:hypothetical protein